MQHKEEIISDEGAGIASHIVNKFIRKGYRHGVHALLASAPLKQDISGMWRLTDGTVAHPRKSTAGAGAGIFSSLLPGLAACSIAALVHEAERNESDGDSDDSDSENNISVQLLRPDDDTQRPNEINADGEDDDAIVAIARSQNSQLHWEKPFVAEAAGPSDARSSGRVAQNSTTPVSGHKGRMSDAVASPKLDYDSPFYRSAAEASAERDQLTPSELYILIKVTLAAIAIREVASHESDVDFTSAVAFLRNTLEKLVSTYTLQHLLKLDGADDRMEDQAVLHPVIDIAAVANALQIIQKPFLLMNGGSPVSVATPAEASVRVAFPETAPTGGSTEETTNELSGTTGVKTLDTTANEDDNDKVGGATSDPEEPICTCGKLSRAEKRGRHRNSCSWRRSQIDAADTDSNDSSSSESDEEPSLLIGVDASGATQPPPKVRRTEAQRREVSPKEQYSPVVAAAKAVMHSLQTEPTAILSRQQPEKGGAFSIASVLAKAIPRPGSLREADDAEGLEEVVMARRTVAAPFTKPTGLRTTAAPHLAQSTTRVAPQPDRVVSLVVDSADQDLDYDEDDNDTIGTLTARHAEATKSQNYQHPHYAAQQQTLKATSSSANATPAPSPYTFSSSIRTAATASTALHLPKVRNNTNKPVGGKGGKPRHSYTAAEDLAILQGLGKFAGYQKWTDIFNHYSTVWLPGRTPLNLYDHWRATLKGAELVQSAEF